MQTESYLITHSNCNQAHKKCKYLGSILDTTEDFKRRKQLTIESMKTFSPIWKSKYVSIETKYRIFKTRVSPIMLYNSHLWTSNNTLNGQINAFHRRMLNIKWPRIITNDELKRKIGYDEWTNVIEGTLKMESSLQTQHKCTSKNCIRRSGIVSPCIQRNKQKPMAENCKRTGGEA